MALKEENFDKNDQKGIRLYVLKTLMNPWIKQIPVIIKGGGSYLIDRETVKPANDQEEKELLEKLEGFEKLLFQMRIHDKEIHNEMNSGQSEN